MEVSGTADEMFSEGVRLFEKFGDVSTIKVPCTREGLDACYRLSKELVKTNVTLVFCGPAILQLAQVATLCFSFRWSS